jgi:hypothetical protein
MYSFGAVLFAGNDEHERGEAYDRVLPVVAHTCLGLDGELS